jgi:hypothetical protein
MSEVPPVGCVLATPAWLMSGWGCTVAGVLAAGDGRLAFLTEEGPRFDVAVTEVTDVTWPWHWFGGGVRLHAAGAPYKITFVLPAGAVEPAPSLVEAGISRLTTAAGGVPPHPLAASLDVGHGRCAARLWKEVLPAA